MKPEMKVTILYHGNCMDGTIAAAIVFAKHSTDGIPADNIAAIACDYTLAPWLRPDADAENYDAWAKQYITDRYVYIVDFSFSTAIMLLMAKQAAAFYWFDHHATPAETRYDEFCKAIAAEESNALHVHCTFDKTRSGAGIAWDECTDGKPRSAIVNAVELRDLWRPMSLQETRLLSGLHYELHEKSIPDIARFIMAVAPQSLQYIGEIAHYTRMRYVDGIVQHAIPAIMRLPSADGFEETVFITAVNCPSQFASDVGHELVTRHQRPALCWAVCAVPQTYPRIVRCSLRSSDDYAAVDRIAHIFGGGGHRNAAGFSTTLQCLQSWLPNPSPTA